MMRFLCAFVGVFLMVVGLFGNTIDPTFTIESGLYVVLFGSVHFWLAILSGGTR